MNAQEHKPRKLFLMRHGERVDFVFRDWISHCFNQAGDYRQIDLNMPACLPKRSQGYKAFAKDTPLTKVGLFQAKLTGEAFKETEDDLNCVFCTPSLRCVQTCDAFLQGWGKKDIKIKIEPGLFEWLGFYSQGLPDWMTPGELVAAGYNVDLDYKPFMTIVELKSLTKETCEEFYKRIGIVTDQLLEQHSGNVLFVGHSANIDTSSRHLVVNKPRCFEEMAKIVLKVPYCCFLEVREKERGWEITGTPLSPVTHASNANYDHSRLLK